MEIKIDSKNYRLHNDKSKSLVRKSLKELGAGRSIIVDAEGNIIGGNCTFEQAKKLNIPVEIIKSDGSKLYAIQRTDLKTNDEKRKKLAILDNSTTDNSDFDFQALQEDFNLEELADLGVEVENMELEEETEVVEDEVSEEVETRCKLGDIWQLGSHRLMCGDSTKVDDVEKLMNGNKADMCFTDPPYGVNYTGGLQFKNGKVEKNNRQMIKNDDIDIYEEVFAMLAQYVNGACYIWFADTKARSLYEGAEKFGNIHALIIWVKNGGYGALNANYKQKHEPCLYWNPKNTNLKFIGKTTETTIWEIDKDGINKLHPTQKPIALVAKALQNHDANTVLDLFGGSGSTLIACEQLNRKCFMMELDEHYCDVIIQRWETLTGKEAVLCK